jgi:hypothetical protein
LISGGARGQRGGGVLTAAQGIQRGVQAAPRDVDGAATFPSAQAATSVKIQAMSPFWPSAPAATFVKIQAMSPS